MSLLAIAVSACSQQSDPAGPTYNAVVTTDEAQTSLELVKLTYDDTEAPQVEILGYVEMGYGALPFLVNLGEVPEPRTDVPSRCLASRTLGIDDATPCLAAPTLGQLDPVLAAQGLSRAEVVLSGVFNTGFNESYTEPLVDDLATRTDQYAETQGYSSEIGPDRVEASAAIQGPSGGPEAYNHSRDIADRPRNATDWMSELKLSAKLSQLSIPGTHDTIAYHPAGGGDSAWAQSMNLERQLNGGIRFLDIRLKCRQSGTATTLYGFHGIADQYINFEAILDTIQNFLTAHRGETIYARIKNEGSTRQHIEDKFCYAPGGVIQKDKLFWEVFADYYDNRLPNVFWKPPSAEPVTRDPTLRETQGKLVVIRDFGLWNSAPRPEFGLVWGASNATAVLEWTVSGATSLSIDQGVGPVTGTRAYVEPGVTRTYTLTATNASGSATRSVTITVGSAPVASPVAATTSATASGPGPLISSFTATPSAIPEGGAMNIQDDYHLAHNWELHDKKWGAVKAQLGRARGEAGKAVHPIHVNFLSGSGGSFPYFVASGQWRPGNGSDLLYTGVHGCRDAKPVANTYRDFPRRCRTSTKAEKCGYHQSGNEYCWVDYLGTNQLARKWLDEPQNRTDYTGIVPMDFPGGALIHRIIDVNRHTLLK